jgi:hypothetical protein
LPTKLGDLPELQKQIHVTKQFQRWRWDSVRLQAIVYAGKNKWG